MKVYLEKETMVVCEVGSALYGMKENQEREVFQLFLRRIFKDARNIVLSIECGRFFFFESVFFGQTNSFSNK